MRTLQAATDRGGQAERAGCGFLSPQEVQQVIDATLPRFREDAFEAHRARGCAACDLLAEHFRAFRSALEDELGQREEARWDPRRASEKRPHRFELLAGLPVGWVGGVAAGAILLLTAAMLHPRPRGGVAGPVEISLPGGGRIAVQAVAFSIPSFQRDEGNLEVLWSRSKRDYEAGRWADAASTLAEIEQRAPDSQEARFLRGVAFLMSGKPAEARASLQQALSSTHGKGPFAGRIQWHLGLAAIAERDIPAARKALLEVQAGGGAFAGQAAKLLARLQSIPAD